MRYSVLVLGTISAYYVEITFSAHYIMYQLVLVTMVVLHQHQFLS